MDQKKKRERKSGKHKLTSFCNSELTQNNFCRDNLNYNPLSDEIISLAFVGLYINTQRRLNHIKNSINLDIIPNLKLSFKQSFETL
jgi:hypothetical protein